MGQADVVKVVNSIAHHVHTAVTDNYGSPNKNIGDAFLVLPPLLVVVVVAVVGVRVVAVVAVVVVRVVVAVVVLVFFTTAVRLLRISVTPFLVHCRAYCYYFQS